MDKSIIPIFNKYYSTNSKINILIDREAHRPLRGPLITYYNIIHVYIAALIGEVPFKPWIDPFQLMLPTKFLRVRNTINIKVLPIPLAA